MHEIVVHEEADEELKAAAVFYESREEGLGNQFLNEVASGFDKIQSFPFSRAVLFDEIRSCLLRRFPYTVVYRVELNRIFVLAVAHLHRRPLYWRNRAQVDH